MRLFLVPTVHPFGDVTGHAVNAQRALIPLELIDGRPPGVTVHLASRGSGIAVVIRSGIGAFDIEIVAPRIFGSRGAAGCLLPLLFGREAFARPLGERIGIPPIHIENRAVQIDKGAFCGFAGASASIIDLPFGFIPAGNVRLPLRLLWMIVLRGV